MPTQHEKHAGPASVPWALQLVPRAKQPTVKSHISVLYVLLAPLQVACHRKSGKICLTEERRKEDPAGGCVYMQLKLMGLVRLEQGTTSCLSKAQVNTKHF